MSEVSWQAEFEGEPDLSILGESLVDVTMVIDAAVTTCDISEIASTVVTVGGIIMASLACILTGGLACAGSALIVIGSISGLVNNGVSCAASDAGEGVDTLDCSGGVPVTSDCTGHASPFECIGDHEDPCIWVTNGSECTGPSDCPADGDGIPRYCDTASGRCGVCVHVCEGNIEEEGCDAIGVRLQCNPFFGVVRKKWTVCC